MASRYEQYDGVTDANQLRQGFVMSYIPRISMYRDWLRWYDNDFGSLTAVTKNLTNGLSLFDAADLKVLPFFSVSSKYYQDSVLARRPVISLTHENDPLQRWIDEHKYEIFYYLDRAMEYWSITGRGVLTTAPDRLRAVDPSEWVPIQDPQDKEELIGHALMHPWRERLEADLLPDTHRVTNRMNKVHWAIGEEVSTLDTYRSAEGQVLGPEVGERRVSDINGVFIFGNGRGFYGDIAPVAMSVMVHWTLLSRRMHRFSDPPLMVPLGAGGANVTFPGDTTQQLAAGGNELRQRLLTERGPLIEVMGQVSGNFGYLQADVKIAETLEMMRWLGSIMHLASGVSPQAFGQGIGAGMGGEAIRQAMLRSGQLITEQRSALERLFPSIIQKMGAPILDLTTVTFTWPDDPFEDRDTSVSTMLELLSSGELLPGEVRQAAGWPPLSPEELLTRVAALEQLKTRTFVRREEAPDATGEDRPD